MNDGNKAQPFDSLTLDTAPNRLTALRILAVPIVVALLAYREFPFHVAAAVVFTIAAITDYFDGYIARTRKLITVYGKLMDPLADKFLVIGALVMLQYLGRIHPFVVIVLICRELGITSLRALASAEGVIIAAGAGGKWKAALQMVGIPFLILDVRLFDLLPCHEIGLGLIYLSVALSVSSAFSYTKEFFIALRRKRAAR